MDNLSEISMSSLQTLDDVLTQDKQRYKRKGYGLIVAILITTLMLYIAPYLMEQIFIRLQDYNVIQIHIMLLLSSSHVSYMLANFYMWVIYSIKLPFFERYKIDNTPWPWDQDPIKWNQKKIKVLKNWIINASIGSSLVIFSSYQSQDYRIDLNSLPTHFEIIWQMAICMILEDMTFYWLHRFLHHPKLYPYIHKQHHEFYHPISFSAEYAHPIEFLFGNSFPTMVGPLLLRGNMHLGTLSFWLILRVFETIDGHCGYEFSWSPYRLLPFSGSSEYHHYHHSHNIGNYSSFFYYWDTLCGTNKSFFRYKDAKIKEYNYQLKQEQQLQKLRKQYKQKSQ